MSYCTSHDLTINCEHTSYNATDLILKFRNLYEDAADAIDDVGSCNEDVKWYDAEDQLCEFSQGFPGALFVLHGEGQEAGDIWNLYVKNGKSYRDQLIVELPAFDESKLK